MSGKPNCTCVENMNAKLVEHNTRICETIAFPHDGTPGYTLPQINTEKVEKRVRRGPAIAIPSFCPFCGTKYGSAA